MDKKAKMAVLLNGVFQRARKIHQKALDMGDSSPAFDALLTEINSSLLAAHEINNTDDPAPPVPGEVIDHKRYMLTVRVGSVAGKEGDNYEVMTGMQSEPMVRSELSDKTYRLDWIEIVQLAIAAGVNNKG